MENSYSTTWEWLSSYWFLPSTLQSFQYEKPVYLYLIAAIPLLFLFRWLFYFKFRRKIEVAFFERQVPTSWTALLRFVPDILLFICIALILVALSRPQRSNERTEQFVDGIDIMLVLDISESMKIEDFKPNRMEAAKRVAKNFIEGRIQDRIGAVIFAGDAYSLVPLTTDYEMLNTYISDITFDMIDQTGTAIGSALAVATNRMLESTAASRVIILLSDGDNTAGNIDPITAAKLAAAYNIKIYTIAIGKNGKVPYGKDIFGNPQYVENTLDETTLREIAKIGNGTFFRAVGNQTLINIFEKIDQLEKSKITETRFKETKDYYRIYLMWAISFYLLWLLTKVTFMSNPLED
jgi:Ca-activated chloride channel family protein